MEAAEDKDKVVAAAAEVAVRAVAVAADVTADGDWVPADSVSASIAELPRPISRVRPVII